MREIKFRGQRADNNEWVYGFYRKNTYYDKTQNPPKELYTKHFIGSFDNLTMFDNIFEQVQVIPETVGQFTGFKDKNGVEIYEGDILTDSLNMFVRGVNYVITSSRVGFDICNHEDYIVIGNIHENKELLTNKL